MYEPRLYRGEMNRDRFRFFRVIYHESDLMVGVPHHRYHSDMEGCAERELIRLRQVLLDYSQKDPRFISSLDPLDILTPDGKESGSDNQIAKEVLIMLSCGKKTGTGPMASVAGLFARQVGREIIESFGEMEVVVENGGDLYLLNERDLVAVIHAGESDLSDKMAFVVPPGEWGICTSSGTMGHSFSQGRADAVMVISPSAPLADAWATSIANRVNGPDDIEQVLEDLSTISEIIAIAIIAGNQVGVRGELQVKLLS